LSQGKEIAVRSSIIKRRRREVSRSKMEGISLQDERWEFDAPKFMDFERLGSPGMEDVHADTWFDTSATKGLASPESGSGEDHIQQQVQGGGGYKDQGEVGIEKENQSAPGLTRQTGVEGKQQVRAVLAHICGNTTPMTRQMSKKAALASLQSGGGRQGRDDSANVGRGVDARAEDHAKKKLCISIYEPVVPDDQARVTKKKIVTRDENANPVSNSTVSRIGGTKPVTRSQTQVPTPPGIGQGQSLVATPMPADVTCSEKETKRQDVVRNDKLKGKRIEKAHQKKPWSNKLTVPKSPMLRSKQRCNSERSKHVKSSEELELEEIAKKKKEAQKMREKSQRYIEASLRGSSRLAPKPVAGGTDAPSANKRRPLTVPKEPKLRTSKRQRTGTSSIAATVPNLITSRGSGFTMGSRNKAAEASQRETRQRKQTARPGPVTRNQVKPRLTRPNTPNFATKRRARAPRYKTSEEIELEQIAQYKPFQPRPITRSMAAQKSLKQVVKAKKALTVPQPFSFATDRRATRKPPSVSSDPPMFVFGAEGPVTRSKAKQTTTSRPPLKSSTKEGTCRPSRDSNTSFASESTKSSIEKRSAPKVSLGGASLGRAGGSLLRGGAVRVLQPAPEVIEDEPIAAEKGEICGDADADLFQDLVDGVHDFIKVCFLLSGNAACSVER